MAKPQLQAEYGNDATHLVGIGPTAEEQYLYDLLTGHWERSKKEPSIENFRLCVEAYDNLVDEIRKR